MSMNQHKSKSQLIAELDEAKHKICALESRLESYKQTDNALQESKVFLENLLNAMPIPVFYKDVQGRYLGFNKAFEMFFGKTREELLGKSVFDINPPELAKIYYSKDRELFANKGEQQYQSQVQDVDGVLHEVIFNKAVFTDRQDNIAGLIGTILDITEHKRAENSLQESEERFRAMFEAIKAVAWYSSADGSKLHIINSQAERLYGLTKEEMLAKPNFWLEAVHPEDRAIAESSCNELQYWKESDTIYRIKRYNGEVRWLWDRKQALLTKDGEVQGLMGIAIDITTQKQVEKALAESENELTALFNAISETVILLDLQTRILAINDTGASRFELSKNDMVGKSLKEFMPRATVHKWKKMFDKVISSAKNERFTDQLDGRTLNISVWPIVNAQGKVYRLAVFALDVTRQQEMIKELQDKTKGLEEANTALKVLLEHRDAAKLQLTENVLAGINTLVRPYLNRIREEGLNQSQQVLADVLEANLHELIDPLAIRLSFKFSGLTSREIEIAAMIREGKSSDEIAQVLNVSYNTIIFHRQNLRSKLGIKGQRKALSSFLRNLMD